jgi:hypothetical protein
VARNLQPSNGARSFARITLDFTIQSRLRAKFIQLTVIPRLALPNLVKPLGLNVAEIQGIAFRQNVFNLVILTYLGSILHKY